MLLDAVVRDFEPINKILLISPNYDDRCFIRKIFPEALIIATDIYTWNLNDPPPRHFPRFDLAVSSNVLMYSSAPEIWISNILSITNLYVAQDIKYLKRSSRYPYLGIDGDSMRYTLATENTPQPSFALSNLSVNICKYFEFEGIRNEYHKNDDPPVHICVAMSSRDQVHTPVLISYYFLAIKQNVLIFVGKNIKRIKKRLRKRYRTSEK